MLGLVTVIIPLLEENWQMPLHLKESLYKRIFENPLNNTEETYLDWLRGLSDEDQLKVTRVKFPKLRSF